jgi:hypothetical protein
MSLARISIGPDPIPAKQSQEELSRPWIVQREAILDRRFRDLMLPEPGGDSLPREFGGRAFSLGRRSSVKGLDAAERFQQAVAIVHGCVLGGCTDCSSIQKRDEVETLATTRDRPRIAMNPTNQGGTATVALPDSRDSSDSRLLRSLPFPWCD